MEGSYQLSVINSQLARRQFSLWVAQRFERCEIFQ
jgi:hypothetical protein